MCIRDRLKFCKEARAYFEQFMSRYPKSKFRSEASERLKDCLLYTSDAADERSSVDLGGRRIIKKKKTKDS